MRISNGVKVATALRTVLEGIKILDSEVIKLTCALGRVLAQDLYADYDIPQFENSAMDGYALRSIDVVGTSRKRPKVLEVVADLKAGDVARKKLGPGESARIMTGALLPPGADSVIMVEDTQRQGRNKVDPVRSLAARGATSNGVEIFKEVEPGENVRRKAEDVKKGELVIRKGTLLKCAHIGLLASLGKSSIKVTRRPKVAILATGDELVDVGRRLTRGKIRSSNTYTLFSQVIKCGGIPINLGIAKDNSRQLERKIKEGLGCDIILTSGGVSVGDHDLVKDVLAKMGTNIKFWKVAMRPGKPLAFGTIRGIPVFGLPGNPVSSMVSFEVFVRPAILKMLGQNINPVGNPISNGVNSRKEADAILEEEIRKKKEFKYFLRAETRWEDGRYLTRTTGPQGSGILKSMVLANSLIILPEEAEFIEKGTKVIVRFLD